MIHVSVMHLFTILDPCTMMYIFDTYDILGWTKDQELDICHMLLYIPDIHTRNISKITQRFLNNPTRNPQKFRKKLISEF